MLLCLIFTFFALLRLTWPSITLLGLATPLDLDGLLLALAMGFPWQSALAVGLILSLSSTAIVMQLLAENRRLSGPTGQTSFSILLFQDLAIIPALAVLPLAAGFPLMVTLTGTSLMTSFSTIFSTS